VPRADLGGSTNTSPARPTAEPVGAVAAGVRRAVVGGIALALAGSLQATIPSTVSNTRAQAAGAIPASTVILPGTKIEADRANLMAPRSSARSRSATRPAGRPVRHTAPKSRPRHRPPRWHRASGAHRHSVPHYRLRATGRAASIIAFALGQIGKRYRYGSAGPRAYDCSGLVMAAYRHAGIPLPHGTRTLVRHGRAIGRAALRPGDIVFLTRGHVAIYLGGNQIVEAANRRAGIRRTLLRSFWAGRRVR
jgi:cell wall-associated NlpC family hydrolase